MSDKATPIPGLNSIEGLKKYWDLLPEIIQDSLKQSHPAHFAPKPEVFEFLHTQKLCTSEFGRLPIMVGDGLVGGEDVLKCLLVDSEYYPEIFFSKYAKRQAIRFIKKLS